MNKRKILLLAAVLVMVAVLGIGGTLAYFTDEATKTNTFTLGNVDIEIQEWMDPDIEEDISKDDNVKDDWKWNEYEDHELWPTAQSKARYNKVVDTYNTGSEDAYIRTYITCPVDEWDDLGLGFNSGKDAVVIENKNKQYAYPVTWKEVGGTFTINGKDCRVIVCEVDPEHNKTQIVKAGESVISLTKVWLYESVDNGDVASSFDINVGSQAIQAMNLTYDEAMAALGTHTEAIAQLWPATQQ